MLEKSICTRIIRSCGYACVFDTFQRFACYIIRIRTTHGAHAHAHIYLLFSLSASGYVNVTPATRAYRHRHMHAAVVARLCVSHSITLRVPAITDIIIAYVLNREQTVHAHMRKMDTSATSATRII